MPQCKQCRSDVPSEEVVLSRRGTSFCRRCYRGFVESGKNGARLSGRRRETYRGQQGRDYSARARNLRVLGFKTYAEYLASPLWKAIRERVFGEKGRQCLCCGRAATQVHHNNYDLWVLSGEQLWGLVPLCGGCHQRIEFEGESKLTVMQAKAEYKGRRKKRIVRKGRA